jgi:hypothetical protein
MKDRDTQYLFESYLTSLEEGRKKKYEDRARKTVIDPSTGEERPESYYEMMMRLKGNSVGARSRATRARSGKVSTKVKLGDRKFKVADLAYETRLKGEQRDVIRFVEVSNNTKASDILKMLTKNTDILPEDAKKLLGDMITLGYLDEVFDDAVDMQSDDDIKPETLEKGIEGLNDISGGELSGEDDLEDY